MSTDYRDREEMAQEREREERRYRSWDRCYEPSYRCSECGDVYVKVEDAVCDGCKERRATCVECGEYVDEDVSMCLACAAESEAEKAEAAADRHADEIVNLLRETENTP